MDGDKIGTELRPEQGMQTHYNKIDTVEITEYDYGYSVRINCKRFAIETSTKLIAMLTEYISNPQSLRDRWKKEGSKIFNNQ